MVQKCNDLYYYNMGCIIDDRLIFMCMNIYKSISKIIVANNNSYCMCKN